MKQSLLIPMLAASVLVACTDTPTVEEGFLDANGAKLFFKTMGSGEPIIVLHGGPGFSISHPRLRTEVSRNRTARGVE